MSLSGRLTKLESCARARGDLPAAVGGDDPTGEEAFLRLLYYFYYLNESMEEIHRWVERPRHELKWFSWRPVWVDRVSTHPVPEWRPAWSRWITAEARLCGVRHDSPEVALWEMTRALEKVARGEYDDDGKCATPEEKREAGAAWDAFLPVIAKAKRFFCNQQQLRNRRLRGWKGKERCALCEVFH